MLYSSQPHENLGENESYRSDLDISMELKEEDHFVKKLLVNRTTWVEH